jgi:hypothetical protein
MICNAFEITAFMALPAKWRIIVIGQELTAQSFIVRIYRTDNKDSTKISGILEALDSSGKKAPFRDGNELMVLLNKKTAGRKSSRKSERKEQTQSRQKCGVSLPPT